MRFLYTPPTGEPQQRRGEGEDVKERGVEKQGEQKDQEMLLQSQRFFRQGRGGNDAAAAALTWNRDSRSDTVEVTY